MSFDGDTTCDCGEVMHRVPQMPAIVWGQLRPSQGELHPNIKQVVDSADERREKFQQRMEARASTKLAMGAA